MTNLISAAAGTVLLVITREANSEPHVRRAPIVAWMHVQGAMAHPITAFNAEGIPGCRAYLFADGSVADPESRLMFNDESEWLRSRSLERVVQAHDQEPYLPGVGAGNDGLQDSGYGHPEPLSPAPRDAPPVVLWHDITWAKESLVNTSFWSWQEFDAIFTVPAGHPRPHGGGVKKVTRGEYKTLKSHGARVIERVEAALPAVAGDAIAAAFAAGAASFRLSPQDGEDDVGDDDFQDLL